MWKMKKSYRSCYRLSICAYPHPPIHFEILTSIMKELEGEGETLGVITHEGKICMNGIVPL